MSFSRRSFLKLPVALAAAASTSAVGAVAGGRFLSTEMEETAAPAEKVKRIVKPKYRTPDGFEWTGRGRQPKKIAEAIAAGHSLESMEIH